jgi:hypothetical protein
LRQMRSDSRQLQARSVVFDRSTPPQRLTHVVFHSGHSWAAAGTAPLSATMPCFGHTQRRTDKLGRMHRCIASRRQRGARVGIGRWRRRVRHNRPAQHRPAHPSASRDIRERSCAPAP